MLLFQIYLVFGWFFLSFFFELFDVFISHILSPCTPRTPFPTMLYSLLSTIWKRQSTVSHLVLFFLGENKRCPIKSGHFWVFLYRTYVLISVLSTCSPKCLEYWSPFWWSHTCYVFFFGFFFWFFCCYCFRRVDALLLDFCDKLTVRSVCTWTRTKCQCRKKSLKKK